MVRKISSVLALLLVVGLASAADSAVIPDTGTDVGAYISSGIVKMAAVAGIAVGGYFAFLIIKKGVQWAGKALG